MQKEPESDRGQDAQKGDCGREGSQRPAKFPDARPQAPQDASVADSCSNSTPTPVEIEAAKIVLTNSVDYIKTTAQTLQALTGLLLTAYVALLVGFCKDTGLPETGSLVQGFLPIVLLIASLLTSGISAIFHKGGTLWFDEARQPQEPLSTLDQVLKARRRQLLWPGVLTLLSVVAILNSFLNVMVPAQQLKRTQPERDSSTCSCSAATPAPAPDIPPPSPPPASPAFTPDQVLNRDFTADRDSKPDTAEGVPEPRPRGIIGGLPEVGETAR